MINCALQIFNAPENPVAPGFLQGYVCSVVADYRCAYQECTQYAWGGTEYCRDHHPSPEDFAREISERATGDQKLFERCNWSGCDFTGADLSGKDFRYCRFSRGMFSGADLSGTRFLMCFLDEIDATGANFIKTRMMSVMAAGSVLVDCPFTGSDIINVNFNGVEGSGAVFNESDLFCSRFVRATLSNAQLEDCNLTWVDFTGTLLSGVSFTDSNPEEAFIIGDPG